MFILKKGHQPGVYVPLRALFLVVDAVCSQIVCACQGDAGSPLLSDIWQR